MSTSFILLFEERGRVGDHDVDKDTVLFQDRFEPILVAIFFEIETEVVVLHCDLHRSEGLLGVPDPALRLLYQLAGDLDCTKI